MKIHENIATMRKRNTKSQQEIAEALGISRVSYGKLERGESSVTFDRIQEICGIFDCTLNELINISTVEVTHITGNLNLISDHNNLIGTSRLQHQYTDAFECLYQTHKYQFSGEVLAELKAQIKSLIEHSNHSVSDEFVDDLITHIQRIHDAKEYAMQL